MDISWYWIVGIIIFAWLILGLIIGVLEKLFGPELGCVVGCFGCFGTIIFIIWSIPAILTFIATRIARMMGREYAGEMVAETFGMPEGSTFWDFIREVFITAKMLIGAVFILIKDLIVWVFQLVFG